MEPIEQVHPSLAALQRAYGPADDQLQAVAEAYGAIRAGSAPFIVTIIARMLPDWSAMCSPRPAIGSSSSAGTHAVGAAVRGPAPPQPGGQFRLLVDGVDLLVQASAPARRQGWSRWANAWR